MSTKTPVKRKIYADGWLAGYETARLDFQTNTPKTQQQFYDLTSHDLDTIAMGIALVVLHAADIQTIKATMDTQQKLGVAEKVLGWLHLICEPPEPVDGRITLHETAPNPWLDLGEDWEQRKAQQFQEREDVQDDRVLQMSRSEDDEIPF